MWSLMVYSLPQHKEFRFLLPALQLVMPYCGLGALYLQDVFNDRHENRKGYRKRRLAWSINGLWALTALLMCQIAMGLYFSLVHHR